MKLKLKFKMTVLFSIATLSRIEKNSVITMNRQNNTMNMEGTIEFIIRIKIKLQYCEKHQKGIRYMPKNKVTEPKNNS